MTFRQIIWAPANTLQLEESSDSSAEGLEWEVKYSKGYTNINRRPWSAYAEDITWVQFPISTPVLLDKMEVKALHALIRFRTEGDVRFLAITVNNGEREIYNQTDFGDNNLLNTYGTWITLKWDLSTGGIAPTINGPVMVNVQVLLINGNNESTAAHLDFVGAGVEFQGLEKLNIEEEASTGGAKWTKFKAKAMGSLRIGGSSNKENSVS